MFCEFQRKNLKIKVERHFQEKISSETQCGKNAICSDFEKFQGFSSKKAIYFFRKKPQISNFLRFLTIPVAFYGKFATFSDFSKNQYFFSTNPSILLKKTRILNVSTENLLQFGEKIISRSDVNKMPMLA